MKQKMVQDLLNVIDQLQNHLLTQHQAITQEQVSCHNCGQYNIKRDLLFKELTLLHHELERMIKSNRRISISGIPTERIYNLATRICFACEEHKEMHKHNKRRQSFCQHPENLTESDEGDDYIEGPLMVSISWLCWDVFSSKEEKDTYTMHRCTTTDAFLRGNHISWYIIDDWSC